MCPAHGYRCDLTPIPPFPQEGQQERLREHRVGHELQPIPYPIVQRDRPMFLILPRRTDSSAQRERY